MQKCRDCKVEKPLSDFHRNAWNVSSGGYSHQCKLCKSKKHKEDYARLKKDPVRYAEVLRRSNERSRALRKKYPMRSRARGYTHFLIEKGELVKMPCEVCGNPNTEAHHKDYSNPKDVAWFCLLHHKKHHEDERKKVSISVPCKYGCGNMVKIVREDKRGFACPVCTLKKKRENRKRDYLLKGY